MYITFEEDKPMDQEEVQPTGASRQTEIAATGFTPGPWEVSTTIRSNGDWPCVRGALDEDGGWVVALIDQCCVSRSTLEPEANARLIAAAPALYEALADLAFSYDARDAGDPCWCRIENDETHFERAGVHDRQCLAARAAFAAVRGPQTERS